jgi:hypothetical protein
LTAAFLDEDKIETLWNDNASGSTIFHSIKPLTGFGDILEPRLQKIAADLYLIPGDAALATYEDTLSNEWAISMGDNNLYRPQIM